MKKRSVYAIVSVGILILLAGLYIGAAEFGESAENDTKLNLDSGLLTDMRIENEDKLVIPRDKTEEVWNYLLDRLVNNKEFIQSLDAGLYSYWQDELFTDVYFDTPELAMFHSQSGVRHRKRVNLTDPNNRKHGRELMQVKLNNIDGNEFNRGELKFDIDYPTKIKTADDIHAVIGIIKNSDREPFKKIVSDLGIDPRSLRKILTNEQRRRSIYIPRNGEQFISIRLDECSSDLLWSKWRHVELEPELNEIPYTEGDEAQKAYMENINKTIIEDILKRFPYIRRDLTPKYNKAFQHFQSNIPLLNFWIKHRII